MKAGWIATVGVVLAALGAACSSSSSGGGGGSTGDDAGSSSGATSSGSSGASTSSSGGGSSGASSSSGGSSSSSSSGASSSGGSPGSSSGASGDGGTEGGGSSEGGLDCSAPSLTGAPTITHDTPTGNPPTMTGGTIVAGTYFETSEDDYNGQSPENSTSRVLVIDPAASSFRMEAASNSGTQTVVGSVTVSSPTFTLDGTPCGAPAGSTLTIHYTATATTLSWVDPNHANRVQNFTKQ